jgi:hypothetical protein
MKNWKICIGCQKTAKGLKGVRIRLGPKPERESTATGMFPNALRLP